MRPGMISALTRLVMHRRAMAVILLLALVPRAAMLLCAVTPTSDADWYYGHAAQMAAGMDYLDGHGHPTAFWPVGWPWLLSLAFRAGGTSLATLGVLNLGAALLTVWLTRDLGRLLTGSEGAGRIAALLYAVYPNAVLYVPLALTEVPYTALLLVAVKLLVDDSPARQSARWVLAGLVLALATLIKAQTLVIVPAIVLVMALRTRSVWRPALCGALVLGTALLAIAPWTVRNHQALGAWVMVSTNGGYTLLTGNNDSANGTYTPDDPLVKQVEARTDLDEVARDALARNLAKDWIATHPARFAALAPLKLIRLWGPDGEGQWAYETGSRVYAAAPKAFLAVRAANQALYWALLAVFVIAPIPIIRARRAAGQPVIDWWLVAYMVALFPSLIAVVFSGQSRFHFPAMPFLCMIAGWMWESLAVSAKLKQERHRPSPPPDHP